MPENAPWRLPNLLSFLPIAFVCLLFMVATAHASEPWQPSAEMKSYCSARWADADRHDILGPLHNDQFRTQIVMNFHAYPAGSLVGADFTMVDAAGSDFSGQDLTCARFHHANLGRPTYCSPQTCAPTDEELRKMGDSVG